MATAELRLVQRNESNVRTDLGMGIMPRYDVVGDEVIDLGERAALLSVREERGLRHVGEIADSGDYDIWYIPVGYNNSPSRLVALPVGAKTPSAGAYVMLSVRVDTAAGTVTEID